MKKERRIIINLISQIKYLIDHYPEIEAHEADHLEHEVENAIEYLHQTRLNEKELEKVKEQVLEIARKYDQRKPIGKLKEIVSTHLFIDEASNLWDLNIGFRGQTTLEK